MNVIEMMMMMSRVKVKIGTSKFQRVQEVRRDSALPRAFVCFWHRYFASRP